MATISSRRGENIFSASSTVSQSLQCSSFRAVKSTEFEFWDEETNKNRTVFREASTSK